MKSRHRLDRGLKIVRLGGDVEFVCSLSSDVKWSFDGRSLPKNAVTGWSDKNGISRLKIIGATLQNGGNYICCTENDNLLFEETTTLIVSPESKFE